MLRYYAWALAEKFLSYVPLGGRIYYGAGSILNRKSKGRNSSFGSSFRLTRIGKGLLPAGGVAMEVGSGWYHHDAFLLYLVGNYKVYLFDIQDKASLTYVRNYMGHLLDHADLVSQELSIDKENMTAKINKVLSLPSLEAVYKECNFIPAIVKNPSEMFLPPRSVDFMVGNCVLNHIPVRVLIPELSVLANILKDEGRMCFLLGHDDHWTFHDRSANQFNYYRYSDRFYRMFFETSFEFQNRLVKQEWLEVFRKCGLEVETYDIHITDQSRDQIRKLPHIDSRFRKYPLEELAIIHSYVVLKKSPSIQ